MKADQTASAADARADPDAGRRTLGFWAAWSMTVGVMIGSGIFTLPAVLAPKGLLGFGGWIISAGGAICLALTLSRLAAQTRKSGGPFVYAHQTFGEFTGFLMAWAYWCSYWSALPAIAIAFIGYLAVFIPGIDRNSLQAILAGLIVIWVLTINATRGMKAAAFAQLVMTVFKIAPLLAVIALGAATGKAENLPPPNPEGTPLLPLFAATSLLTMWAFIGMEAATLPAGAVKDAERVIPRAVTIGTLTVTALYLAATAAVMALVPMETLRHSTSPFADAARGLGSVAPYAVAIGAMISTAGAINGSIIVCGEIALAAAMDGLAPKSFARLGPGGSPVFALVVSSILGSILLVLNYTRGFIGAFQFLVMMSTVTIIFPLLVSAAAEITRSLGKSVAGLVVAALASLYCLFVIFGAGAESLFWGVVLILAGVPVYFVIRRRIAPALKEPA